MQTANMIPVDEFCIHHNIELSFIYSLQDSGLLQITRMEQKFFVTACQLPQLEKIVRLYRDLDINL